MKVLHFEATYLDRAGATCHQPHIYADSFRAARLSLEIFGATEVALKCLGEIDLHAGATYVSVPEGLVDVLRIWEHRVPRLQDEFGRPKVQ